MTSDLGPLYEANDLDERGRVVGEMRRRSPSLRLAHRGHSDRPHDIPIGVLWEDGRVTLLETADAMFSAPSASTRTGRCWARGA